MSVKFFTLFGAVRLFLGRWSCSIAPFAPLPPLAWGQAAGRGSRRGPRRTITKESNTAVRPDDSRFESATSQPRAGGCTARGSPGDLLRSVVRLPWWTRLPDFQVRRYSPPLLHQPRQDKPWITKRASQLLNSRVRAGRRGASCWRQLWLVGDNSRSEWPFV